jgi:hypothetical protein
MKLKLADLIKIGPVNRPQRGTIYGVEGVGKTCLATQFPQPIIIDTEASSHRFECSRINVSNATELETAIELLLDEPHTYQTIVIDTIDWAERYLLTKVCQANKVTGIEDFGYGKGWTYLREAFEQFLFRLNGFIRAGRHVILIGHAQVKRIQLPGLGDPFDRYEMKLEKRNADTLTEWVDFQLFINWDIRTAKTKDGQVRAVGGRERLIYPVHTAAYDAKNRLGLTEALKCEYAAVAPLLEVMADGPGAEEDQRAADPAIAAPIPGAASGTNQTPPELSDLDETSVEPFLSDQDRHVLETFLAELPPDRLLGFLRDRKLIHQDEDHTMLGPQYCRRILADLEGFRKAVESA